MLVEFRVFNGDCGVFYTRPHVSSRDDGPANVLVDIIEKNFPGAVVNLGGALNFSFFKCVKVRHPQIADPQEEKSAQNEDADYGDLWPITKEKNFFKPSVRTPHYCLRIPQNGPFVVK